jgi:hypothetical protein
MPARSSPPLLARITRVDELARHERLEAALHPNVTAGVDYSTVGADLGRRIVDLERGGPDAASVSHVPARSTPDRLVRPPTRKLALRLREVVEPPDELQAGGTRDAPVAHHGRKDDRRVWNSSHVMSFRDETEQARGFLREARAMLDSDLDYISWAEGFGQTVR